MVPLSKPCKALAHEFCERKSKHFLPIDWMFAELPGLWVSPITTRDGEKILRREGMVKGEAERKEE